eukprot:4767213-Karenia_brevis.AAC.2
MMIPARMPSPAMTTPPPKPFPGREEGSRRGAPPELMPLSQSSPQPTADRPPPQAGGDCQKTKEHQGK